MLPVEAYAALGAVAANIGAVAVAAIRVVSANRKSVSESEGRIAQQINGLDVRAAKLETKVDRAEGDIQAIFKAMPKRAHERQNGA